MHSGRRPCREGDGCQDASGRDRARCAGCVRPAGRERRDRRLHAGCGARRERDRCQEPSARDRSGCARGCGPAGGERWGRRVHPRGGSRGQRYGDQHPSGGYRPSSRDRRAAGRHGTGSRDERGPCRDHAGSREGCGARRDHPSGRERRAARRDDPGDRDRHGPCRDRPSRGHQGAADRVRALQARTRGPGGPEPTHGRQQGAGAQQSRRGRESACCADDRGRGRAQGPCRCHERHHTVAARRGSRQTDHGSRPCRDDRPRLRRSARRRGRTQRGAGTTSRDLLRDDDGRRDRRGTRDQRGTAGERRAQRRGGARLRHGTHLTRATSSGPTQHRDDRQGTTTGGLPLGRLLTRRRSRARRPVVRGAERRGDRSGRDDRGHRSERDRRPAGRAAPQHQPTGATATRAVRRLLRRGLGPRTVAEQALAGLASELGEAVGRLTGCEGTTHRERARRRRGGDSGRGAREQSGPGRCATGRRRPRPGASVGRGRARARGEGDPSRLSGAGCRARPRGGRPRSGSRGAPRCGLRPSGLGLARQVPTPTVVRQHHRPGRPDLVGKPHGHRLRHGGPGEGPGVPGLLVGDTPHHGRQPTTRWRRRDVAALREGGAGVAGRGEGGCGDSSADGRGGRRGRHRWAARRQGCRGAGAGR